MLHSRTSTAFATYLSCLIAVLCMSGCASGPAVQADTAAEPPPGFLADIPAEPYWAVASLEPVPEEMVDSGLAAAHGWASASANGFDEASADDDSVLARLRNRMTAAELEDEFGIARSPHVAFYGVSAVPFLRVELADAATFRAALESLEEETGVEVAEETHAEKTYRRYRTLFGPNKSREVLVYVDEDEVVVTVPRGEQLEVLIPYLVGERELESTMADAGTLQELQASYDLSPYLVGLWDSAKVVDLIAQRSDATGLQAEVEQAYQPNIQRDERWEREVAELTTLTTAFPRVVGGVETFDAETFEVSVGTEAAPDIIAALNETRSGFVGWQTATYREATFSVGLGLDIGRFLDLSTHEATRPIMGPFESWDMRDWNAIVGTLKRAAATAPMGVRQLNGVAAIVRLDEIDLSAFSRPKPTSPLVLEGLLGAGHAAPASLLAAVRQFAPQLLPEQIGDEPMRLDALARTSPFLIDPYLHATESHLAITTGGRLDDEVETVFEADATGAPLAQARLDFGQPARTLNRAIADKLEAIAENRDAYPGVSDAMLEEARAGLARLDDQAPGEDEPSSLMMTVDTRGDALFATYRYEGPSLTQAIDLQQSSDSIQTLFEVTSTPPKK
jgi:hypothetical protein